MIQVILAIFLTTLAGVAFILGKKYTEKDIENEAAKQALKEANNIFKEREEIKEEYDALRKDAPADWPADSQF